MSDTAKGWLPGTLLILLAVVFGLKGYLGSLFSFLDAHSWVVTAAAATVTAVATVYIAWFTKGTWGIFQIEQERARSAHQRFSADARNIAGGIEMQAISLRVFLKLKPAKRALSPNSIAEQTQQQLRGIVDRTDRLLKADRDAPTDVVQALQLARASLPMLILKLEYESVTRQGLQNVRDRLGELAEAIYESTGTDSTLAKNLAERMVERVLRLDSSADMF